MSSSFSKRWRRQIYGMVELIVAPVQFVDVRSSALIGIRQWWRRRRRRWRVWGGRVSQLHQPQSGRQVLAADVVLLQLVMGERRNDVARRPEHVDGARRRRVGDVRLGMWSRRRPLCLLVTAHGTTRHLSVRSSFYIFTFIHRDNRQQYNKNAKRKRKVN